jgi:type VI secretion system protein VasL
MTDKFSRPVKTGGDPRTLADFVALREELSKLTHPARPDVDWQFVEQLSLSLFRQNGVELQTVVWYTLARTHLAGLYGLNEGLAILDALLTHQWGALWPQPVHARMEILSGFSQRLQTILRTLMLNYADLPLLYQAEQHLNALRTVLTRLELKNASQMGELCTFMHNAATRLENTDASSSEGETVVIASAASYPVTPSAPLVYVAREAPPAPRLVVAQHPRAQLQWKGFVTGMLATLVLGGVSVGWWTARHQTPTPLPVVANSDALEELARQSPDWLQHYGFALAAQAQPPDVEKLKAQWQQHITGNAIPVETLSGWHQGMDGLQELTRRLNALDERKGKYMTGSELKSMVFAITQSLERAVPVEEQLYLLSQSDPHIPLPATQLSQTDMHLNQLLNRYALIKQQATSPLP